MAKRKPKEATPVLDIEERQRTHTLADFYHHREAVQFTHIQMETISWEEAEDLTDDICIFDFESRYEDEAENEGVRMLDRLISGIAALEDHEYRQICAERAIRRAFASHTNAGRKGLSKFVAETNRYFDNAEDEANG